MLLFLIFIHKIISINMILYSIIIRNSIVKVFDNLFSDSKIFYQLFFLLYILVYFEFVGHFYL